MKKDDEIYIRIEEAWKLRLENLAKQTKDPITEEVTTPMALGRRYLKEGILRDEKKQTKKRKRKKG